MSEKELLLYILDWLKLHHGDVLGFLLDDVPSAAVILSGRSEAAQKLEQMEKQNADDAQRQ